MATEGIAFRPDSTPIGGPRPTQGPRPVDPVSRDRKRDPEKRRRRRTPAEEPPEADPEEPNKPDDDKGARVDIRV